MSHIGTLLTLDPGKQTGYALVELRDSDDDGVLTHPMMGTIGMRLLDYGDVAWEDTPEKLLDLIADMAEASHREHGPNGPKLLTIEHYQITGRSREPWSLEVIGMAKLAAVVQFGPDVVHVDTTQQPSAMKTLTQGARNPLVEWGVKYRGSKLSTHTQDALGHAILYAARLYMKQARIHP